MSRLPVHVALTFVFMPILALATPDAPQHLSVNTRGEIWRATESEVYGPEGQRFPINGKIIALAAGQERAWIAVHEQLTYVHVVDDPMHGISFKNIDGLAAISDDIALVHGTLEEQERKYVYLIDRAGEKRALRVSRYETQQGPSLWDNLADLAAQFTPAASGVWITVPPSASSPTAALYFIPRVPTMERAHGAPYALMAVKALAPHKLGGACVHDGVALHFVEHVPGEVKLRDLPLPGLPAPQIVAVRAHPSTPRTCLALLPNGIYSIAVGGSPVFYAEGTPGATAFSVLELEGEPTVLLHTPEGLHFSPTMRPPHLTESAFGPPGATIVIPDKDGWLWSRNEGMGFTHFRVPRHWMWSVLPFALMLWLLETMVAAAIIAIDEKWLKAQGVAALVLLGAIEGALTAVARSDWIVQLLRVDVDTLTAVAFATLGLIPFTIVVLLVMTRLGRAFLRTASSEKPYAVLLLILLKIPFVFRRMFGSARTVTSVTMLPAHLIPQVKESSRAFVDVPAAPHEVGETAKALHAAMVESFARDGLSFPVVIGVDEPAPTKPDEVAAALTKALGPLALDALLVLKPLLLQRRIRVVIAASDMTKEVTALATFADGERDKLAGCVVHPTLSA